MTDFDLEAVFRAMWAGETDPVKLAALADKPNREVHVIPVPRGWSPEQAWHAISCGDELTDLEPEWAVVEVKDNRLVRLVPVDEEAD